MQKLMLHTKSVNKICSASLKFNKFIIICGNYWHLVEKNGISSIFCTITLPKFGEKYSMGLRGSVGASKSHKLKVPGSNPGQNQIFFSFIFN